jgi:hypothetical protein
MLPRDGRDTDGEAVAVSKRTTGGDRAIGALTRIRRVLSDFYDSPEPRSVQHALMAIRSIVDEQALLATAPAVEACEACKRARCDCYDRECDKCHWPGSPNCRSAGSPRVGASGPHASTSDDCASTQLISLARRPADTEDESRGGSPDREQDEA